MKVLRTNPYDIPVWFCLDSGIYWCRRHFTAGQTVCATWWRIDTSLASTSTKQTKTTGTCSFTGRHSNQFQCVFKLFQNLKYINLSPANIHGQIYMFIYKWTGHGVKWALLEWFHLRCCFCYCWYCFCYVCFFSSSYCYCRFCCCNWLCCSHCCCIRYIQVIITISPIFVLFFTPETLLTHHTWQVSYGWDVRSHT